MNAIDDPITATVEKSGLTVAVENWVTLPASDQTAPLARISTFRETPDGTGRIFVNDLRGELWQIEDDVVTEFADLSMLMPQFQDAPGLGTGFQSFAFDPDFATNGKFYTGHSEVLDSDTDFPVVNEFYRASALQGVVTEWTMTDPMSNTWDGTHREILRVDFPGHFHGLQEISFNPNAETGDEDYGLLYIALGDGGQFRTGTGGDASHRLDSVLGTILRIDPDGTDSANGQYGIPTTNPYADDNDETTLGEIYAWGFRNPHRFSFDPVSGKVLVGEIGQDNIEEINLLVPGADYGWFEREGTFAVDALDASLIYDLPTNDASFGYTYPVAQYDHDEGFAIAGGYVYRGTAIPELYGQYVFADVVTGRMFHVPVDDLTQGSQATIYELTLTDSAGQATTLKNLIGANRADVRFGLDADGEIYLLTKTDGTIRKLINLDDTQDPGTANYDTVTIFGDGDDQLSLTSVELAGRNYVEGGAGKDVIDTGAGDDFIAAGAGTDYSIYGGAGADIFSLSLGDTFIRIRDFEDGTDMIHLGGGLAFADLTILDTSRNGADRTTIFTQNGDRLVLNGVAGNDITVEDFVPPSDDQPPASNTAPTLDIFAPDTFTENTTTAAMTITVADFEENDPSETLTLSVTGADADAFTLNFNALGTYELFFVSPPDFENSMDVDGDNIYQVTLTVTDPQGLFTSQDVDVIVTDVVENDPVSVLPTSYSMIFDGTENRDKIVGSDEDDLIRAGAERDQITAGAGDDVIFAGAGPDYNVTGGTGADVFVFQSGSAHLRILDFENGLDKIALSDGLSVDDLAVSETSNGVNLTYTAQDGTSERITLKDNASNVWAVDDIDADDFVLVSAQEIETLLLL